MGLKIAHDVVEDIRILLFKDSKGLVVSMKNESSESTKQIAPLCLFANDYTFINHYRIHAINMAEVFPSGKVILSHETVKHK